jgi:hypothetical protein
MDYGNGGVNMRHHPAAIGVSVIKRLRAELSSTTRAFVAADLVVGVLYIRGSTPGMSQALSALVMDVPAEYVCSALAQMDKRVAICTGVLPLRSHPSTAGEDEFHEFLDECDRFDLETEAKIEAEESYKTVKALRAWIEEEERKVEVGGEAEDEVEDEIAPETKTEAAVTPDRHEPGSDLMKEIKYHAKLIESGSVPIPVPETFLTRLARMVGVDAWLRAGVNANL